MKRWLSRSLWRKENWEKGLRYAITQEIEWWPQYYRRRVGSPGHRTKQKAANIQRRALECSSRSLENYSWRRLKEKNTCLRGCGDEQRWSYQILTLKLIRSVQIQFFSHILYFCSFDISSCKLLLFLKLLLTGSEMEIPAFPLVSDISHH